MRNLRDYKREELLALPAGEELDGLVWHVIWKSGADSQRYSSDLLMVGVMLEKLHATANIFMLSPHKGAWCLKLEKDAAFGELPHVCALALVLAAWEKAKREENKE